ncbi:MAG TPA: hypothetical protein DD471_00245 [Planctomycetes bacterium]|nr:hypothetical protein [Planctomycetota bacterium]|tara:strand:+ start:792 stop:1493 length:702 start_codon:yes stop_codon:yes gene_type:complete
MPVFAFEAIKEDGQKVKSEVTAESKDEAIRKIQDKGLRLTRIKAEKKSPFGSKKSGFKGKKTGKKTGGKFGGKPSGKPGGKRPESQSAPSNYRAPPMRKPGVPTGAVLAIAAPLVAILFFVVFGSKIFTDTTEVEVLDPNTKIRALEKRVGIFASQYSKVRKLTVEENPGAEARSEALLNQMQKWMLDWDKVMKPYQDADGYMKPEFKGYRTTHSRVSRIMYDLSKSKGFFDD